MWKVTPEDAKGLLRNDPQSFAGPPVALWRRLDDGTETIEYMTRWLAEWTLAGVPHGEPMTRRARIIPVLSFDVSEAEVQ
jgi:hypothetical protein